MRIFIVFFLCFLSFSAFANPPTCSSANVVPIGGVIEPNGGSWRIYAQDNMHASINLISVSVNNPSLPTGYVQLNHTCGTYIGSVVVEEDESYSKAGVQAGASEDTCWIKIFFGQNGSAISPNTAAAISGSPNLWIWGYTCGPVTTDQTAYSTTLTTDEDVWNGYNLRVVIPASKVFSVPSGTPTHATMVYNGCTSEPLTVTSASMCNQASSGDPYDCASIPQATPSGVSVPQNGSIDSGQSPFIWDKSSNIIANFYFNGGTSHDCIRRLNATGAGSMYYKIGSDETGTANVTGYTGSASNPNATGVLSAITMDGF